MYKNFISIKEMRKDIKNYDLVEINLEKEKYVNCMIVEFRKEEISILPTDPFMKGGTSPDLVPKVAIPYSIISGYKKLDKLNLLFLIHEENPHLKIAIEDMFYNEEKSCRKD